MSEFGFPPIPQPPQEARPYDRKLANWLQQVITGDNGAVTLPLSDDQGRVILDGGGVYSYDASGNNPIAPNRVEIDTQQLVDASVATAKLQDSSVATEKIANLAVGTAQVADAAILQAKIGDAEIVNAKIADLAVNDAKVADLSATKLTAGTIGADNVLVGSSDFVLNGSTTPGSLTITDADATERIRIGTQADGDIGLKVIGDNDQVIIDVSGTNDFIDADFITVGTLDASQVVVSNINAGNITTGTLNANRIDAAERLEVGSPATFPDTGEVSVGGDIFADGKMQPAGGLQTSSNIETTSAGSISTALGNIDTGGAFAVDGATVISGSAQFVGSGGVNTTADVDGARLFVDGGNALSENASNELVLNEDQNFVRSVVDGDLTVTGALSKGSGTFRIPNPCPHRDGDLVHSFVESPTAGDNLYRWTIDIDEAEVPERVELPDYWPFLNEDPQVWVSPVRHFGRAYGEASEDLSALMVVADQPGRYNVLLIGTRKDPIAKRAWKGVEVGAER